jgi:hypothetical protein
VYVLLEKQSAGVSFNGIQALQQCYINPATDNTAYIYRSATSVYQVGCYVFLVGVLFGDKLLSLLGI